MSESNDTTLQSYEGNAQAYVAGTPQDVSGAVRDWLDEAVSELSSDARILEFGSAFGRDAAYLQGLGYKVECSDAADAFVVLLQKKGFNARTLNAITDDIAGPYELILANAVLLHFNRQETADVLAKVFAALSDGGKFAFTLKQGVGESWSDEKLNAPRYFCYWTKEQIAELLSGAGYENLYINAGTGARDVKWLHIIACKPA